MPVSCLTTMRCDAYPDTGQRGVMVEKGQEQRQPKTCTTTLCIAQGLRDLDGAVANAERGATCVCMLSACR